MRTIPIAPYPTSPLPWPPEALKGRGSAWQMPHRFERVQRAAEDDGWGLLDQLAQAETAPPNTVVLEEHARNILAGNDSPDIGFDLSINPYRGCEHGCIYMVVFRSTRSDLLHALKWGATRNTHTHS